MEEENNKIVSRNKQQDLAMAIIYQCIFLDNLKLPYNVVEIVSDTVEMPYSEVDPYIKQAVVSAMTHKFEMKELIDSHLRGWRFERLPKVEVAILFLAYAHYHYVEKVDRNVVISIAVEQAHKYLDATDYKFVNAILEKIL